MFSLWRHSFPSSLFQPRWKHLCKIDVVVWVVHCMLSLHMCSVLGPRKQTNGTWFTAKWTIYKQHPPTRSIPIIQCWGLRGRLSLIWPRSFRQEMPLFLESFRLSGHDGSFSPFQIKFRLWVFWVLFLFLFGLPGKINLSWSRVQELHSQQLFLCLLFWVNTALGETGKQIVVPSWTILRTYQGRNLEESEEIHRKSYGSHQTTTNH